MREEGLTYSRFIAGVKATGIEMDRKILAAIAFDDPAAFKTIIDQVKAVMHASAEDATVAQLAELTEHPGQLAT